MGIGSILRVQWAGLLIHSSPSSPPRIAYSSSCYGIGCLGRTAILSLNVTAAGRLHTAVLDLLRDSVSAGHGRAPSLGGHRQSALAPECLVGVLKPTARTVMATCRHSPSNSKTPRLSHERGLVPRALASRPTRWEMPWNSRGYRQLNVSLCFNAQGQLASFPWGTRGTVVFGSEGSLGARQEE